MNASNHETSFTPAQPDTPDDLILRVIPQARPQGQNTYEVAVPDTPVRFYGDSAQCVDAVYEALSQHVKALLIQRGIGQPTAKIQRSGASVEATPEDSPYRIELESDDDLTAGRRRYLAVLFPGYEDEIRKMSPGELSDVLDRFLGD